MDGAAAATGRSLFDGRRSALGQVWRLRPADDAAAEEIRRRHGLPDLVARVLAARGVASAAVPAHLNPTLRSALPDPACLTDMEKAAARAAAAIAAGDTVAVFADYDVDGATSAAQVLRYFRAVGAAEPALYVPDRSSEGYGPNVPAIEKLAAQGTRLLVLVDCGTTALEPLQAAQALGIDCLVLDHHATAGAPAPALAVVNPNRPDDASGLGYLAACGVVFLFLVALNRALRSAGRFAERPEPDLLSLLDLVALGSVCDVVPLIGLNRALVRQGLAVARAGANPGIAALAAAAGLKRPLDVSACGFAIGPRINAGGRLGQSDMGARLLAGDDAAEAARLAGVLSAHNENRKTLEADTLAAARMQAEAQAADGHGVVLAAGDGWHPGVVGLVAGRLRERLHMPACAVAMDGDLGKGSGRSVPGFDLGRAIIAAHAAGLLEAGGGHPMAAGFTVRRDRLAALHRFLDDAVAAGDPHVPELDADAVMSAAGATPDTEAALAALGPFGVGNPEPRLVVPGLRVAYARPVGIGHLACRLRGLDGAVLDAIAFRVADTPLAELLDSRDGVPLAVAGSLMRDEWQGRTQIKLRIDDAMAEAGGDA
ncbi:MAG: single-stranded-DNA-specific exonuclease RecJ [Rhodospirillaceae bacterium]|nr:single-stranded-DNA-specific exonuclease RecJ [Rhodospirillaceae bacterium]